MESGIPYPKISLMANGTPASAGAAAAKTLEAMPRLLLS